MTTMIELSQSAQGLVASQIRWLDYAAFVAMGLLWLVFFAMFFAIYKVIRSKARGDDGWGDSPGL